MLYVLVGGPFEIIDTAHKYEIWGQPAEIPEDLAKHAIADGVLLLPKESFDSMGFTADELKFSNARLQEGAPKAFKDKHAAAIQAAREYRTQLMEAN